MAIECSIGQSETFDGANKGIVKVGKSKLGEFHYRTSPRLTELLYITTRPNIGKHYAPTVIGQFINQVGRGIDFKTSTIIHPDSWITLLDQKLLEFAYKIGTIQITDRSILSSIPIVHILQSGGLTIKMLELIKRDNTTTYQNLCEVLRENPDQGPSYFETAIYGTT